jgi:hypothetical protein
VAALLQYRPLLLLVVAVVARMLVQAVAQEAFVPLVPLYLAVAVQ